MLKQMVANYKTMSNFKDKSEEKQTKQGINNPIFDQEYRTAALTDGCALSVTGWN